MQMELTEKEFRRLLDMVYIGNWILNSTRGSDRFADYDQVESRVFSYCKDHGMESLIESWNGRPVPSRAFAEGGWLPENILWREKAAFRGKLSPVVRFSSVTSLPCSRWRDIAVRNVSTFAAAVLAFAPLRSMP